MTGIIGQRVLGSVFRRRANFVMIRVMRVWYWRLVQATMGMEFAASLIIMENTVTISKITGAANLYQLKIPHLITSIYLQMAKIIKCLHLFQKQMPSYVELMKAPMKVKLP